MRGITDVEPAMSAFDPKRTLLSLPWPQRNPLRVVHVPNTVETLNQACDLFVLWDVRVALRNFVLDLDSTANGLNDTGKLGDDAVAGAAEDVTAMGGDRFLHHGTVRAHSSCGSFFVKLRKMAVLLHIGGENRSKPTFHGTFNGRAPQEPAPKEKAYILYITGRPEAR